MRRLMVLPSASMFFLTVSCHPNKDTVRENLLLRPPDCTCWAQAAVAPVAYTGGKVAPAPAAACSKDVQQPAPGCCTAMSQTLLAPQSRLQKLCCAVCWLLLLAGFLVLVWFLLPKLVDHAIEPALHWIQARLATQLSKLPLCFNVIETIGAVQIELSDPCGTCSYISRSGR